MSGQYEDDLDNCEDVVYTGQGGHNLHGNRRQFKDQVMEKGNLGLKVWPHLHLFFVWSTFVATLHYVMYL